MLAISSHVFHGNATPDALKFCGIFARSPPFSAAVLTAFSRVMRVAALFFSVAFSGNHAECSKYATYNDCKERITKKTIFDD